MKEQRVVWSHSSLKLYELCPRKYQAQRVTKETPFVQGEEQKYGDRFHEAAQKTLETGCDLPPEFSYARKTVAAVEAIPGSRHAELKLGADVHLHACGFFDQQVWCRGIVDFLVVDESTRTAYLGDWKTGKDRYPDKEQLVLMSLLAFLKFDVDIIRSALVYVVKGSLVPFQMQREEALALWQTYRERVARLEQAYASDVWNATPNFTCRKWCQVEKCEHHGR